MIFLNTVKKKTQINATLMKVQFDQFNNILFMSISCNLFKIIKTVQYAQNTIKCDINFRKECYVDCFFQKEFSENVVDIH